MANDMASEAQLFWDTQGDEDGWTLRYHDAQHGEQAAAIEGDVDASLDDLELAAEIALDGYSGRVRIYRGEQVARKFELRGAPSESERIALDAKIEGRHVDAKAIREEVSERAGHVAYSVNVVDSDKPSAWMRAAHIVTLTAGLQDSGRCAFRVVTSNPAALESALDADDAVLTYEADS